MLGLSIEKQFIVLKYWIRAYITIFVLYFQLQWIGIYTPHGSLIGAFLLIHSNRTIKDINGVHQQFIHSTSPDPDNQLREEFFMKVLNRLPK